MKNYKPKAQDLILFSLAGEPHSTYRLVKAMSRKDCEEFGVLWSIDGDLQGCPWLARDQKDDGKVAVLLGTIKKHDGSEYDLSEDYTLLEREGIAWQS